MPGVEAREAASSRDLPLAQSGRVRFAGILVILIGAFNLIQGIAAAAQEKYFAVTPDGLLHVPDVPLADLRASMEMPPAATGADNP